MELISLLVYSCALLLGDGAQGLVLRSGGCKSSVESNVAWPIGVLGRPLAFDIGLYNGRDTLELLRTGHRVIAVEANPLMYDRAMQRFSKFVEAGVLKIVHGAIANDHHVEAGKTVPFYVHKVKKDWSSLMKSVGCRKSSSEMDQIDMSQCDEVQVKLTSCAQILQDFGAPYYLKLDIEGHEMACLQELQSLAAGSSGRFHMPHYISMEANNATAAFLWSMTSLGYGRVKMVDQALFGDWSGPYGELAKDIQVAYQWNSISGFVMPKCPTWCDLHVSLGPADPPSLAGELTDAQLDAEVLALAQAFD